MMLSLLGTIGGIWSEKFDHMATVQNFIIKTFKNEGAEFAAVHINRAFPADNSPDRKPGTGMLTEYFDTEKYDLKNSFTIGDRKNDVLLAYNLGAKSIWLIRVRAKYLAHITKTLALSGYAAADEGARTVLKIETAHGLVNLPDIVVQADGRQPAAIMIARGDLSVEIGFARVAEIQEELLWLAEAASVPSIWATQVLENLVKKGLPSRGEMTDAAMSARAECVMLNKGPYLLEAIDQLRLLFNRMDAHQHKKFAKLRRLHSW